MTNDLKVNTPKANKQGYDYLEQKEILYECYAAIYKAKLFIEDYRLFYTPINRSKKKIIVLQYTHVDCLYNKNESGNYVESHKVFYGEAKTLQDAIGSLLFSIKLIVKP